MINKINITSVVYCGYLDIRISSSCILYLTLFITLQKRYLQTAVEVKPPLLSTVELGLTNFYVTGELQHYLSKVAKTETLRCEMLLNLA